MGFKVLGREPALMFAVLTALVSTLGTLNIDGLSGEQAAIGVLVVNAVAGVLTAIATRPIAPGAFTYLVGMVASLIGAYGYDVSEQQVGAVNALVIAVLAFVVRGQVAPQETKISKA